MLEKWGVKENQLLEWVVHGQSVKLSMSALSGLLRSFDVLPRILVCGSHWF